VADVGSGPPDSCGTKDPPFRKHLIGRGRSVKKQYIRPKLEKFGKLRKLTHFSGPTTQNPNPVSCPPRLSRIISE
jgi:hypothetical protein